MKRLELAEHSRVPLVSLLGANAISLFGSMLTVVALPWFVLQTTGSASKAGLTLAVDTVPILFAGLFGGVLVDRFGFKRSSILSDLASAVGTGAIPLIYFTVGISFWQLLVIVFLASLVNQPGKTARTSLIPDLAEKANMPLRRVNSIAQSIPRFALLFGPPLAGILVSLMGAANVLFIDALSYVVSALIVAIGITRAESSASRPEQSFVSETLTGLRHIGHDRLLFWLVVSFSIGSLVAEPVYSIVYPVFARQIYHSAVSLGLMFSALAIGSLAGLGIYAVFGSRIPTRPALIVGFGTRALVFCVMVVLPSLPVLLVMIAVESLVFEPINPMTTSIMQERTPAEMRGRVFGTISAIGVGTLPIGTMIGGFLIAGPGLVTTMAIVAAASVLQTLSFFVIPAFREVPEPIPVTAMDNA
jgi:MFS family permease